MVNAVPTLTLADQEFSISDLEELIEACIKQTDLNFENRSAIPISIDGFSDVGLQDADRFEELTKLQISDFLIAYLFSPNASDQGRQETLGAIQTVFEDDRMLQQHHDSVMRQIGAHSFWKSPRSEDGEWNDYGIVAGSAWWYSQNVAVFWKGSSYVFPGAVCEIHGEPSRVAKSFVDGPNWKFTRSSVGPVTRYVATLNAIAPVPRTVVKMLTGIGKSHSLPSAVVEVVELEAGFLADSVSNRWIIIVSDSRYHDLL